MQNGDSLLLCTCVFVALDLQSPSVISFVLHDIMLGCCMTVSRAGRAYRRGLAAARSAGEHQDHICGGNGAREWDVEQQSVSVRSLRRDGRWEQGSEDEHEGEDEDTDGGEVMEKMEEEKRKRRK